tara:strand:+ start:2143 stop:2517 length:375 start_codon:yes stop_codon:yes gene_type:complete
MKQLLILLVAIMTIAGFTSASASAQCSGEGGICEVTIGPPVVSETVASESVPPGEILVYVSHDFACFYCDKWKRLEIPKLPGWRIVQRFAKPGEDVPYFRVRTSTGRTFTFHGYQPASAFIGLR